MHHVVGKDKVKLYEANVSKRSKARCGSLSLGVACALQRQLHSSEYMIISKHHNSVPKIESTAGLQSNLDTSISIRHWLV